eukprot:4275090-Alexandrium_andersonii.AAC.1
MYARARRSLAGVRKYRFQHCVSNQPVSYRHMKDASDIAPTVAATTLAHAACVAPSTATRCL